MNAHRGNAASLGSLGASAHLTNHTPGAVVSLGKGLVYHLKGCQVMEHACPKDQMTTMEVQTPQTPRPCSSLPEPSIPFWDKAAVSIGDC